MIELTVIIPTHNRQDMLLRCLGALARQDYPLSRMEVIVVADGCTDDSAKIIVRNQYGFSLKVFEQSSRGAAAARNHGAKHAVGSTLVFLDDDVIASEKVASAHARHHKGEVQKVVVGPYMPPAPPDSDFHRRELYEFWRGLFESMAEPNHVPTFRDVVSGNLSMTKVAFERAGGFCEAFPSCGMEDYEFGYRLLSAGVKHVYDAEAIAEHLETTNLRRSVHRRYVEGRGTVTMLQLHPALLSAFGLTEKLTGPGRLMFSYPAASSICQLVAIKALAISAALRSRAAWNKARAIAMDLAYWRGIADELDGECTLDEFLEIVRLRIVN